MENAVLLLTGCLNPPTNAHIKALECAYEVLKERYNVLACLLSPAHEAYPFKHIESNAHRIRMCELALQQLNSSVFKVSTFEALQNDGFLPTFKVVQQVAEEYSQSNGNVIVFLVCGSDLLREMCNPQIWKPFNVKELLSLCRLFVVDRSDGLGGCSEQETLATVRSVDYISEMLDNGRILIGNSGVGSESSSSFRAGDSNVCCAAVVAYCRSNALYGYE